MMCQSRHPLATTLLLLLFVLDTATDIATGLELVLNDHFYYGYAVLACCLLPIAVAIIAELFRVVIYGGCCGGGSETTTSRWIPLMFYHFYTAFMIVASGCFRRWRREAAYLRCLHGFLQSAPQLILQSVIVLKGVHIHSLHQTVEAVQKALQSGQTDGVTVLDSLSYLTQDKPLRWFWGLIQVMSLFLSFLSVLQTLIQFNEWSKRRHTLHRMVLVVPFFAVTILYRVLALALILAFAGGKFGLLPVFGLLLTQAIALNSLGLDMARSFVYGFICSLLAPAGYSRCRDPAAQPFGLTLSWSHFKRKTTTQVQQPVALLTYEGHPHNHEVITYETDADDDCYEGGDRTPEQIEMLRERSKNYLGLHVIVGGALLGISMAILGLLIGFGDFFEPLADYTFLTYDQLNDYLYPGIGLIYLTSVLLTGLFTCCIGRCFEEEYIYPV